MSRAIFGIVLTASARAILCANAFGSTPSSSNWNSAADINNDNVVDIYDAITLANNFGKTG